MQISFITFFSTMALQKIFKNVNQINYSSIIFCFTFLFLSSLFHEFAAISIISLSIIYTLKMKFSEISLEKNFFNSYLKYFQIISITWIFFYLTVLVYFDVISKINFPNVNIKNDINFLSLFLLYFKPILMFFIISLICLYSFISNLVNQEDRLKIYSFSICFYAIFLGFSLEESYLGLVMQIGIIQ